MRRVKYDLEARLSFRDLFGSYSRKNGPFDVPTPQISKGILRGFLSDLFEGSHIIDTIQIRNTANTIPRRRYMLYYFRAVQPRSDRMHEKGM